MANRFVYKPWATFTNQNGEYITEEFETYAKLRSSMRRMLGESINGEVSVTRTRRGEWGQYFEIWQWRGKPIKTKETWL